MQFTIHAIRVEILHSRDVTIVMLLMVSNGNGNCNATEGNGTYFKFQHIMWHIYFSIGFNLAIIINNDNEEPEEISSQQQKKFGKNDKVPIPPAIVISKQSEVIREKLEGLGFGVLYFSNLTTEGIHQLLEAFAQAHHDDLTSFTLVVLSKGSKPCVHDADGQVVPFDEIFKHFSKGKIAEIPKSFFFHLAHTDPPNEIAPFFVPKKSVGFVVGCQQTKEDVSPAVNIYVEEMENCYTTCVGKVFRRMETTIRKQPNTKCKLQNSFEQDVTLPNCYKPSSAK